MLQRTALTCAGQLGLQLGPLGVELLLLTEVLIVLLFLQIFCAFVTLPSILDLSSQSSGLLVQLLQPLLHKAHSAQATDSLSQLWTYSHLALHEAEAAASAQHQAAQKDTLCDITTNYRANEGSGVD